MKWLSSIGCFLLSLLCSAYVHAVPMCTDVFTDPPTGNQSPDGIVRPSTDVIGAKGGNLECSKGNCTVNKQGVSVDFPAGDWNFNDGDLKNGTILNSTGNTARFYFDTLKLSNADINVGGNPEDLFIYVAGSLSITGQNNINGIVYVAGSVQMAGNATLSGAIGAGGSLVIQGNSDFSYDPFAVTKADLAGLCTPRPFECFSDDFSSGSISNLWQSSTTNGNFAAQIVNGRYRLTEAVMSQANTSTYQRLFKAENNYLRITFDHFAYGGAGVDTADGMAVVISDSAVTPSPGAFPGVLGYGYTSGTSGFAGGWLGIGIDEFGNFSSRGGDGTNPGVRPQSVVIRGSGSGESGYRYLAGTCNDGQTNTSSCLSPTVDNNNSGSVHTYELEIDSRYRERANVRVYRKVGNGGFDLLVGPIDVRANQYQADLPDNFLVSLTGATGAFNNVHEIDNFVVCSLDSEPRVIEEQIDHFRLSHSGQGITCEKSAVTVTSCKNSSCTEQYTGNVSVSLAPATVSGGGGWEGGSTQSFSGGQQTFYLRKFQPGTVTLDVASSTPSKQAASNLCQINGGGFSTSNCNLEFSDSGFLIEVPDKYAAELVDMSISAVKTGDSNIKCDALFSNQTRDVQLWSEYINPNSSELIGSPKVSIGNSSAQADIANSQAGAGTYPLSFDINGQTSYKLNYYDAGQVSVNVRYEGTGDDLGLILTGSDNFVSFPASLAVVAKNSAGMEKECTSIDASCDWFTKAGASFDLEVTALGQTSQPTPNYTHSGMSIAHKLVTPDAVESRDGSISTVTYDHAQAVGSINIISQSLSEVGVFDFTVRPPNSYYGSSEKTITPAKSVYLRFIPAYFAASISQTPTLAPTCGSFSYIGQPFGYTDKPQIELKPVAVNGQDVNNYLLGDFWRYNNQWSNHTYNVQSGSPSISIDSSVLPAPTVERNLYTDSKVNLNNEQIFYIKDASPINAFTANFQLTLTKDDLVDLDGVCYKNADSDTNCQGITFDSIGSIDNDGNKMKLYWGRLLLNDTYGSELSALRQRLALQYYDNDQFIINTDDSCTNFENVTDFSFASSVFSLPNAPNPSLPSVNTSLSPAIASSGESWLEFSAPGSGNTGTITSSFDMQSNGVPWLREDVDNDGSLDDDNSVSGQVQFGIYRGSDRVIWWNEQN
ncbi:DUF6701 domain-containing protein [Vibrio pectenicida]|uniref:DUF6701 domain-containing protein n=1 Tax=Vibrio pectenicida TaxID=62763 RepID=UPI003B9B9CBA